MPKKLTIFIIIVLILIVIYLGYRLYIKPQLQEQLMPAVPAVSTPKITTPNIKITSKIYPTAALTPGDVLTMDTYYLCSDIYLNTYRNLTDDEKMAVFARYQLSYPPKKIYQVDRLIPFELGGTMKITNLWPQEITYPGFNEKNRLEKYLVQMVCNNSMNLSDAHEMLKKDWVAAYEKIF